MTRNHGVVVSIAWGSLPLAGDILSRTRAIGKRIAIVECEFAIRKHVVTIECVLQIMRLVRLSTKLNFCKIAATTCRNGLVRLQARDSITGSWHGQTDFDPDDSGTSESARERLTFPNLFPGNHQLQDHVRAERTNRSLLAAQKTIIDNISRVILVAFCAPFDGRRIVNPDSESW